MFDIFSGLFPKPDWSNQDYMRGFHDGLAWKTKIESNKTEKGGSKNEKINNGSNVISVHGCTCAKCTGKEA